MQGILQMQLAAMAWGKNYKKLWVKNNISTFKFFFHLTHFQPGEKFRHFVETKAGSEAAIWLGDPLILNKGFAINYGLNRLKSPAFFSLSERIMW